MNELIENIKSNALRRGACDRANDIKSVRGAGNLLFTPQGREFFKKTGFPDMDTLRKCRGAVDFELMADEGKNIVSARKVLVAGGSDVKVIARNPRCLYHVIVAHGAAATIKASDYAVVTVTDVDAGHIEIENDGTALVTVE